jgi:hypothetical protein
MLLAELELDISQIMSWGKPAAITVLSAIAFFTLLFPKLKGGMGGLIGKLLAFLKEAATDELNKEPSTNFKRKDSDRSSDEPPPDCFAAHLQIIEDTAPNADAAVWWKYAKEELTEAEVAIAEAKLARKSDVSKEEA